MPEAPTAPAAAPAAKPAPVTPTVMGAQPTTNGQAGGPPGQAGTPPAEAKAPAADPAKSDPAAPPGETKEQRQQRLSNASRAARRAAAQNRELLARTQALEAQGRNVAQRAQTAEQQIAQLRALASKDPYAAAKALGLDLGTLAQQVTREGTPEAETARQLAEAREEARQARERVEAWEKQQRAAVSEQQRNQAIAAFHAEASKAETYPNVSRMPESARLAWAMQVAAEDRAHAQRVLTPEQFARYEPSDRQILAHMEKLAAASASPPKAATDSSPAESPAGSATPTTVSSALSSAKFTLPADFDKLSDQQQKKAMARALEAMVPGAKKKAR